MYLILPADAGVLYIINYVRKGKRIGFMSADFKYLAVSSLSIDCCESYCDS
jgi:hypothetical protein